MDILKTATDWAKAELFSTPFFIVFGGLFLAASMGFWQLGKTDMAKAYILPTLVAGGLLTIIGLGLFFTNKSRLTQFEMAYKSDAPAFVAAELKRADSTLKEYKTIVFTAIPLFMMACSLVLLFVHSPVWRASMITTMAMLVVILLIDGTAHARIDNYNTQLLKAQQELKKAR
ncbi:hypothetical protein CLV98_11419 [Dyadobacter jejuensis]|uniref:Uncharacterized protein n=1 Tax=Dyadobacter jejuensis TaxID=1082580 RepID=A0A316ACA1_9BACT|nr:hypothetical protein [Dyadobacter jejuensis]PWJ55251.1 hypothetical protein CLV98_11419 [Dyadobacter jejuensis]